MTLSSRAIWAIGDLHLSFGVPNKEMDIFGDLWSGHAEKMRNFWDACVKPEDIVLIPGDISWAKKLDEAIIDLQWIEGRPGTKVLIRGNHDYWWDSLSKVRSALPKSLHVVQNDVFFSEGIAVAGARLWETDEYGFDDVIAYSGTPSRGKPAEVGESAKIYARELGRLEASLKQLPQNASVRIALTHYPPIGLDLAPTPAAKLFEQYGVSTVVFGHLHAIKPGISSLFGAARGVDYILASSDWLRFAPKKIT